MRRDILKVDIREFFTTVLMLVLMVIGMNIRTERQMYLNWLGIIIYIYSIYSWKVRNATKLFSPYTIFLTFLLLFNYGQCIMWAFDIHIPGEFGTTMLYGRGYVPSSYDIMEAQWYTCLSMLLFHFGAIGFTKAQRDFNISNSQNYCDDFFVEKRVMKTIGKWALIVLTPVILGYRMMEVVFARTFGYLALYYSDNSTQHGYIQILMFLFLPSLICVLIGSDYARKERKVVYLIFAIYTILTALCGYRGEWLYPLVVLIWLHFHYYDVSRKKMLLYIVLGIIAIYIVSSVTSVRNLGLDSITISTLLDVFSSKDSPIINAFFEMGGSMGIVMYFLHTGNAIYPYANTYITAILGLISTRVLNLLGIDFVLIGNWFSKSYLNLSWGTGFSMIGEAYVNGGYVGGLIYIFVLGLFIGKFLRYSSSVTNNNPVKLLITAACMNTIVGFTRGACYLVLKELFYGVFIIVMVIKLISNNIRKTEVRGNY